MKFRNLTEDARWIPSLHLTVEPGDTTPDLDDDTAAGFVGQSDVWAAVGVAARKKQKDEVQAQTEPAPDVAATPEEK